MDDSERDRLVVEAWRAHEGRVSGHLGKANDVAKVLAVSTGGEVRLSARAVLRIWQTKGRAEQAMGAVVAGVADGSVDEGQVKAWVRGPLQDALNAARLTVPAEVAR